MGRHPAEELTEKRNALTLKDRLTDALVAVAVVLTLASVIALWGWWEVIGAVWLSALTVSLLTYGGIHAYGAYINIQRRTQVEEHRDRTGSHTAGSNRAGRDRPVGSTPPVPGRIGSTLRGFGELYRNGDIATGGDILVGFGATGEPVYQKLPQAVGIGGVTGAGKSVTTLNTILSQIVHYNGQVRYIIIDPHMYADTGEELATLLDPLYPFFLTPEEVRLSVPHDDSEYNALLDELEDSPNPGEGGAGGLLWSRLLALELDRRLHGKKGLAWVVVVDEFSALMADSKIAKVLGPTLELMNEQARKVHMSAVLVGQVWKATRTGGTELRNTLPQFKAHRMPRSYAELVVPLDVAKKVEKLPNYQIIFWYNGTDTLVYIPLTTQEDARAVARDFGPNRPHVDVTEIREGRLIG